MERVELARAIYAVSHLSGEFLLRSGQISTEYFDKYRFESQPKLLKEIVKQMVQLLPTKVDFLAGLEMGGIPIATALSLETGIPALFVRKSSKEYGTRQFAEGADFRGKRLCIIEDVITTGGQLLLSRGDLLKGGAIVDDGLCVIFRGNKPIEEMFKEITLKPLFTMQELKEAARTC